MLKNRGVRLGTYGDPAALPIEIIEKITSAANSEFSLIPSEGVSGTFIKVAQRVQIKIYLDDIPPDLNLGPGLSVEVSIHVS